MSHVVDQNPLLVQHALPPFNDIRPEHVAPAIERLLADGRQIVDAVVAAGDYSWQG